MLAVVCTQHQMNAHITECLKIKINPLTDGQGVGWGGRGHGGGVKRLSNLLQAIKPRRCKVCVFVFL